jgi:SAM-dependent methyltransferase
MNEAMTAEFGTVAEWTAQMAIELGPSYYIPAACRGSGTPAALEWLIGRLELGSAEAFLDCGAGVGGPAAYAVQMRSLHPVLVEPEAGACRAARSLFGYPVLQAAASALPLADESFDAAWSLGVLCTVRSQLALLTELRRVVRHPGRIGLLVFVARTPMPGEQPEGNHFPTVESLEDLVDGAGLRIEAWRGTSGLAPAPQDWQRRVDTVSGKLAARHGRHRAWRLAEHQSDLIGGFLADSAITGELLSLRRR